MSKYTSTTADKDSTRGIAFPAPNASLSITHLSGASAGVMSEYASMSI